MEPDRTDFLPIEHRRALHRTYLLRLVTCGVVAGIGLLGVAAGLLLPTHVLLSHEAAAQETQLSTIESALSSTTDAALGQQLTSLENDLKTLSALKTSPKALSVVAQALNVGRSGVHLNGFVYTPAATAHAGTLVVSGVADDRASLQAYQSALQAAAFAQSADLPVAAYAKATAISFMITITLAS